MDVLAAQHTHIFYSRRCLSRSGNIRDEHALHCSNHSVFSQRKSRKSSRLDATSTEVQLNFSFHRQPSWSPPNLRPYSRLRASNGSRTSIREQYREHSAASDIDKQEDLNGYIRSQSGSVASTSGSPNGAFLDRIKEDDTNVLRSPAGAVEGKQSPANVANVVEGDTAGAALLCTDLTLSTGDRDLLSDASWRVMPGERVGLVGPNGCGKSSLLRAILGQQPLDSGRVRFAHGSILGYLEQTAVSGSQLTVWEEVRSRMVRINSAEAELRDAEAAVEAGVEGAIDRLSRAQDNFLAVDGYRVDETIAGILNGLGFSPSDWARPCSEFSGGWQMRIALARLLLGQAGLFEKGVMLLDEPTNHLDSKARRWLALFLKRTSATTIIVSHDVELLDAVCEKIAEVRGGQLFHYTGNYTKFLAEREARQQQLEKEREAKQAEIDRLQGFVDRFGAKATKAAAANSRKKMVAKLQAKMPDAPASDDEGSSKRAVAVSFPLPPPCVREALTVKKAQVGWDSSAPLIHNADLSLQLGMRMVVLGPNGCGKSTLLRALAGRGGLLQGQRIEGEGVRLGFFTQDLAQDLPSHMSALDYVLHIARERDPTITDERARNCLGALGLSGDKALRPIEALSGGEKARAALSAFVLRPCNVLVLDEASNHLDGATITALAAAVKRFKGAVIAVSHDREFCSAIAPTHAVRVLPDRTLDTRVCIFGKLTPEDFDSEAAMKERDTRLAATGTRRGRVGAIAAAVLPTTTGRPTSAATAVVAPETVREKAKELTPFQLKKKQQQMQSRIKKLLEELEKGEQEIARFDEAMVEAGSDADKVFEILKKKSAVEKQMASWEEEWESLEAELQALTMNE